MAYTQANLNTTVTYMVSASFSAAEFLNIANRAVRIVSGEIDLRSSKRTAALSPKLFDDVWDYSCPADLKGISIVDIKPQINRAITDDWILVGSEEFDRRKEMFQLDRYGDPIKYPVFNDAENLISFDDNSMVRKLRISKNIDNDYTVIDGLNSIGTWVAFGDGDNLTADSSNYVSGSACINWDINADGGTTAGIYNPTVTTFDVSEYLSTGSVYVWAYITSATNLTNFIVRLGSDSSNYYSITITTNNEGAAFSSGWNLLRFDMINKSTTGTPDDDAMDYVALYITKDGAKVSETDYRFNNLVIGNGECYNVVYYSKYMWQSNTGTYLENATATTDLINADTEEVGLIELKTAELIERAKGNNNEGNLLLQQYTAAKQAYQMRYPSEAMTFQTTYKDYIKN